MLMVKKNKPAFLFQFHLVPANIKIYYILPAFHAGGATFPGPEGNP
jgi:hypothetical protein